MRRFDLHLHSTYSDGVFSPADLARLAHAAGLDGLALTDHDTVAGCAAMRAAGEALGLEVINGVEISADYEPGTLHMIGLGVDLAHPVLTGRLAFLQRGRAERTPRMVAQLNAAGVALTVAEVLAEAGDGGMVGRPHVAALLIRKGYATGMDDAFDRWLGKGQPGYVTKDKLTPEDSIDMIRQAGGVAVLAHPVQLRLEAAELDAMVARLKAAGLGGIEAYHSDHGPAEEAQYLALAQHHGLKVSGGSDFHGFRDKPVRLGVPSLDEARVRELLGAHAG